MHNRAAIAAIAPRSRSSRRDRGAIANKFLQGIDFKPADIKLENSEAYLLQLGKNLS